MRVQRLAAIAVDAAYERERDAYLPILDQGPLCSPLLDHLNQASRRPWESVGDTVNGARGRL
jgi:hypothetical protein